MGFNYAILAYGALAVAMSVYAISMIILRARLFGTRVYRPMLLNIALAWLPTVIIGAGLILLVVLQPYPYIMGVVMAVTIIAWLLTFPNAPYLITELNFSHRRSDDSVPLYFDILQTLALTTAGLFIGQFGLVLVHLMLIVLLSSGYSDAGMLLVPGSSWALVIGFIYLAGFAIYLGRNIRVNSWDVLHPFKFLGRLITHLRQPREAKIAIGYTLFYGTFIAILHTIFFGLVQLLIAESTVV